MSLTGSFCTSRFVYPQLAVFCLSFSCSSANCLHSLDCVHFVSLFYVCLSAMFHFNVIYMSVVYLFFSVCLFCMLYILKYNLLEMIVSFSIFLIIKNSEIPLQHYHYNQSYFVILVITKTILLLSSLFLFHVLPNFKIHGCVCFPFLLFYFIFYVFPNFYFAFSFPFYTVLVFLLHSSMIGYCCLFFY